jgi:DNA-binding NarL/FixJ family response regulator
MRRNERSIVVVSEHTLCRQGITELLRALDFRVVDTTGAADLAIVDLDHAAHDVRTLIAQVRNLFAKFVTFGSAPRLAAALEHGEPAIETPAADASAVAAALEGRPQRPSSELTRQRSLWGKLTPRQWDVLRGVAAGAENRAIAQQLGVSLRTVKGYITDLLVAFGAANRTELALVAQRAGLRPVKNGTAP